MPGLFRSLTSLFYHQAEVSFSLPQSLLKAEVLFIPVESKRRGYSIKIRGDFVNIRRHSFWRSLAGFDSIYVFEGMVVDRNKSDSGAVKVSGLVLLGGKLRAFFIVWFCFVLMFEVFVVAVLIAVLTSRAIYPESVIAGRGLSELLMAAAVGLFLLLVASAALTLVKAIGMSERTRLVDFCTSGCAARAPLERT